MAKNDPHVKQPSSHRLLYLVGTAALVLAVAATAISLLGRGATAAEPLSTVTVHELSRALEENPSNVTLLDVREPYEHAAGHVDGSRLMPLADTVTLASGLAKDEPVYVICRSGNRSSQAAEALAQAGFEDVRNVAGGMIAWEAAGLPVAR